MITRPSPRSVRWAMLIILLTGWQLLPATGIIPELFLPSLSKTISVLILDWRIYGSALLVTLGEVVLAMVIACGGGITAGAIAADGPVCTMRPGDPGFEECEACQ
ncbi:MAG: hypothetical protein EBY73_04880 [Burkholderiaceae bacterium]|nr:hypothetical protein [Burkholderiaceae bacterium]